MPRHKDHQRRGEVHAGDLKGQWRYRIGDYRLICLIEDNQLVILALSVGHRSEIYT
ncbi:MAG: type II toxin-antitoxin system RelE/ParE family toxin [Clostridia bacterium]|nr:type II toxin-antitoxin system RelE/ParE family toxin [Clostridia bacterium]